MYVYNPLCIPLGLGESGKMTQKKLNKKKNDYVFLNEYVRNILDGLNRYDITGLPETCSKRIVLQSLLYYGYVFFFEKQGNLLALPGMPDGSGLNVYADFAGAYVYGANGYNEHISLYIPGSDESVFLQRTIQGTESGTYGGVIVRENPILFPFIRQTIYYAERQADTLRKIETATANAATPYIITAEESIINTVKEFMNRRDNNEPYIVSSGIFPADKIKLLPFDIQADSIKVMSETYDWYCSHYRELCGIKNSTNIDKKGENLIQDEININDNYTNGQAEKTLQTIQEGLDIVNRLYNTNIRVTETEATEAENGDDDISRISDGESNDDISGANPVSAANDN